MGSYVLLHVFLLCQSTDPVSLSANCRPPPQSEDEMMIAIFESIDRMMSIVRPRKLLYMAIDGVVSHELHLRIMES